MSDGAHKGIGAQRALDTILGGKKPPMRREEQSRERVRERLSKAATPDGSPPTSYGAAADSIARAFLTVLEEKPDTALDMDSLWAATEKKWPGFDRWLGGATGFMVGWAVNCVRWLSREPPVRNPALVEIEVKE